VGNSAALALRGMVWLTPRYAIDMAHQPRHGQFDKCYSELVELLTDHGFNRFEYFFITALELRNSGYFCGVLSTGQLPIQISQLCTHNVLLRRASLSG
jgi:hypothetical protein